MLVFGKALAEYESALAVDEVVLVRGRVDHKDAGKTCLVVQSVDAVRADRRRRSSARKRAGAALSLGPAAGARCGIDATQLAGDDHRRAQARARGFPGEAEVVLDIDTSGGRRLLRLGQGYRVADTPTLRAELGRMLGPRAGRRARPAAVAADGLNFVSAGMTCRADCVRSRVRPLALPLDRGRGVALTLCAPARRRNVDR